MTSLYWNWNATWFTRNTSSQFVCQILTRFMSVKLAPSPVGAAPPMVDFFVPIYYKSSKFFSCLFNQAFILWQVVQLYRMSYKPWTFALLITMNVKSGIKMLVDERPSTRFSHALVTRREVAILAKLVLSNTWQERIILLLLFLKHRVIQADRWQLKKTVEQLWLVWSRGASVALGSHCRESTPTSRTTLTG